MRIAISILLLVVMFLILVGIFWTMQSSPPAVPLDPRTMATVSGATNGFATDLYGRLSANPGNLFFSPASLETALVMAYAGASGRTADQMAVTLHLSSPYALLVTGGIGGPDTTPAPRPNAETHTAFGKFLRLLFPDLQPTAYRLQPSCGLQPTAYSLFSSKKTGLIASLRRQ